MLRYFVSLLLIALTTSAVAEEKKHKKCEESKIRIETFSEVKTIEEKICYGEEVVNFTSLSCKKQKCSAFKFPKRFYISEFLGPMGTPGFKLCREVGGSPEIVEIFVGGLWYRTDRCLFKDGFVDTDSLLDFYIDREPQL